MADWNSAKNEYSKEELTNKLNAAFEYIRSTAQNLGDEEAAEKVFFFTGAMLSKKEVLGVMRDHITHYHSQMITYLRLNNIKPPSYVGW